MDKKWSLLRQKKIMKILGGWADIGQIYGHNSQLNSDLMNHPNL